MRFEKGKSGNPAGRPKGIKSQKNKLLDGLKKALPSGTDPEEWLFGMAMDAIEGGDSSMLKLAMEMTLGKAHATSEVTNTNLNQDVDAESAKERLQSTEQGRKILKLVEKAPKKGKKSA